jgi:hypothetical protein
LWTVPVQSGPLPVTRLAPLAIGAVLMVMVYEIGMPKPAAPPARARTAA